MGQGREGSSRHAPGGVARSNAFPIDIESRNASPACADRSNELRTRRRRVNTHRLRRVRLGIPVNAALSSVSATICRTQWFWCEKTGGRWNRKGIAALYTAQNASLAVLEVLVHLAKAELPDDYVMPEISVPDPAIVSIHDQSDERLDFLYQNGHRGLASESMGFSIPSIIVPHDRIVVLYPEAAMSTSSLAITRVTPFAFDRRLFLPSAVFRRHTD